MGIHSHAQGEKVENDAVYSLGEQVRRAFSLWVGGSWAEVGGGGDS